jgi:NADH-quinone oxidoreductase subunit N
VPSKSASWLSLVPKIAILTLIGDIMTTVTAMPSINGQYAVEKPAGISLLALLMVVSILSLIIGSIAGLTQPRIKRLLAYSGILNVGFILLSIALQSDSGSFNGQ